MPRQKQKPGEIYHTDTTRHKRASTQKTNVLENKSNLLSVSTCEHCGVTMQENMIIRWHGDNCSILKNKLESTWSYISPKLRGRHAQ